ncbi:MAG: thioredoxin family protein [Siculibacillus sp.]|nr:thioredoxin family protein [Siculibacillus sp.]
MSAPRFLILLAGLAAFLAPGAGAVAAAELIVIEKAGCPFCVRFEKEVGRLYDRTDEGKRAPLRRVDNEKAFPDDLRFVTPERITPTFVLVDGGREIARLRGYPGEDFFYAALGTMLAKLPEK